jgi:hypothetical protein
MKVGGKSRVELGLALSWIERDKMFRVHTESHVRFVYGSVTRPYTLSATSNRQSVPSNSEWNPEMPVTDILQPI